MEEKKMYSKRWHTWNGVICIDDPHSRGVGHGGHVCLLPFLLLPVNDEQHQQEEHHQDKNDDASYGSYLVGVSREGSAGTAQAVQVPHYDYTSWNTRRNGNKWQKPRGVTCQEQETKFHF